MTDMIVMTACGWGAMMGLLRVEAGRALHGQYRTMHWARRLGLGLLIGALIVSVGMVSAGVFIGPVSIVMSVAVAVYLTGSVIDTFQVSK
jgi:hypothetical protein